MSTIILIISALLFIATFGIHSIISNQDEFDKPLYTQSAIFSLIPWIAGFILPVFSWASITDYNWLLLFIVNFAVVFFIGPIITNALLVRLASGKGIGKDMVTFFISGIIALIIGLVLQ